MNSLKKAKNSRNGQKKSLRKSLENICEHDGELLWDRLGGLSFPSLSVKGGHLMYCKKCGKMGQILNGESVWQ